MATIYNFLAASETESHLNKVGKLVRKNTQSSGCGLELHQVRWAYAERGKNCEDEADVAEKNICVKMHNINHLRALKHLTSFFSFFRTKAEP